MQAKEGKYQLECNHGVQNGIYCDCDEGWMSSGIHQDDPMTFHWCDAELIDPSAFSYQPRKLGKVQEIFVVIVSPPTHHCACNCLWAVEWSLTKNIFIVSLSSQLHFNTHLVVYGVQVVL